MDQLKFNVNGAVRGKHNLVGIGGVLRNSAKEVCHTFSGLVGLKESNEAKLLTMPCKYSSKRFGGNIIIKEESRNAIN